MVGGRRYLIALLGVLVAGAMVGGYFYGMRPPRPALPFPPGQALQSVRGNCSQGNELLGCRYGDGPRSFVTVRAAGDERSNAETLFATLLRNGWSKETAGRTARDFAGGGAPEDLQPLYCKRGQGCVGLFRFVPGGYALAWFPA
jgi:hypothetical protein